MGGTVPPTLYLKPVCQRVSFALPGKHKTVDSVEQEFIDCRFFQRKYDPEQSLSEFAMISRDEVDMVRLSESLMGVVEKTMQPETASLWLHEKSSGQ